MIRKCGWCDDKNEKSIDTSINKYVKVGSKYYHSDCYKIYITTRRKKRMTEEEAVIEILRLEEITKKQTIEEEYKDKFYEALSDYYKVPFPSNFFIKINAIVKGKYKGMSNAISYFELYEMYSNQKMLQKLDKIGYSKNIKREDRIHWDLGVMVNEYPNYVKSKLKNKMLEQDAKEAINNIKKYRINKSERYKQQRENTKDDNKSTIKTDDFVDDLFDFGKDDLIG